MTESPIQQSNQEVQNKTIQLKDLPLYIKELTLHHCFNALILAGLVAVFLQTFTYLLHGPIQTELQKTLYMYCLLVGPSAFFLFLLHLYDLYVVVKRNEQSIPLSLDLTYFLFIGFSFVTMMGLSSYYDQHQISQKFLTPGWLIGVLFLCGEVLLALLCAKYLVSLFISQRMPHFFEHHKKTPRKKPPVYQRTVFKPVFKPHQVYYFKKKPDFSLWENEEFFVKYK